MVDWNVIYWTLNTVGCLPFLSMVVDLIRMAVLLARETAKYNAFTYRLTKHDYVDNALLDEMVRLSKVRASIARKYNPAIRSC